MFPKYLSRMGIAKRIRFVDKVHEVIVCIEGEPFLPGLKEEAFPDFEQKCFKFVPMMAVRSLSE